MSETQNFKNAPIREAIIDIRFTSEAAIEDLTVFAKSLSSEFLYTEPVMATDVTVNLDTSTKSTEISNHLEPIGWVLKSDSYVFQVKLDGLTVSKLEPYDCWNTFISAAQGFWIKYTKYIEIQKVNRIALRYINSFQIPLTDGKADLSDYLHAAPEVPDTLEVSINAFVSKIQFSMQDHDCKAILIHASEGSSQTQTAENFNIIVDIDVFKEDIQLASSSNGRAIWPLFKALRAAKNEIFLSAITKKTKEMLK